MQIFRALFVPVLAAALMRMAATRALAADAAATPSPAPARASVAAALSAADYAGTRLAGEQFTAAWGRNDARAMAALFAPDADLIGPWGRVARGIAEIEKLLADEQGGPARGTLFSVPRHTVRLVTPDVAIADLDILLAGSRDAQGRVSPPLPLHVTNVLVRTEGRWLIASSRPAFHDAAPAAVAPEPGPSAPLPAGWGK